MTLRGGGKRQIAEFRVGAPCAVFIYGPGTDTLVHLRSRALAETLTLTAHARAWEPVSRRRSPATRMPSAGASAYRRTKLVISLSLGYPDYDAPSPPTTAPASPPTSSSPTTTEMIRQYNPQNHSDSQRFSRWRVSCRLRTSASQSLDSAMSGCPRRGVRQESPGHRVRYQPRTDHRALGAATTTRSKCRPPSLPRRLACGLPPIARACVKPMFSSTVPTPIDEYNRPDLTPLIRASETIGAVLKAGDS